MLGRGKNRIDDSGKGHHKRQGHNLRKLAGRQQRSEAQCVIWRRPRTMAGEEERRRKEGNMN